MPTIGRGGLMIVICLTNVECPRIFFCMIFRTFFVFIDTKGPKNKKLTKFVGAATQNCVVAGTKRRHHSLSSDSLTL